MKKYFFLFIIAFNLFSSCNSSETTTYYLIRHAEKDRTDKTDRNPSLNYDGEKRAQKWASYFKDISLDAVYSTNYNRTIQTATPTAISKNLEIINYDPRNMYDSIFKQNTLGKTVLIVGHSNTTPAFANKILATEKYKNMDDNDNSSLYIITLKDESKESRIEKVD
jgi:broad specificity phosphatase PhoE|tara:strand:- start:753 stop:1250 length:498 start_codon:yes stop_codon:yes gene_type:complete